MDNRPGGFVQHAAGHRAGESDQAVDVDGEDPAPHLIAHLVDGGEVIVDAGDIGQAVNLLASGIQDALDRGRIGEVGCNSDQVVGVPGLGEFIQSLLGDIHPDDAGALPQQLPCRGATDTGGCTSDDDGPAGETLPHGNRCGGSLGHHAVVGCEHHAVDGLLGHPAAGHLHQVTQGQAEGRAQLFDVRAGLIEETAEDGVALGMVEPLLDGVGCGNRGALVLRHEDLLFREWVFSGWITPPL